MLFSMFTATEPRVRKEQPLLITVPLSPECKAAANFCSDTLEQDALAHVVVPVRRSPALTVRGTRRTVGRVPHWYLKRV